MTTEFKLDKPYYFSKLKGQIHAICFCKSVLEKSKVKESVYFHIIKSLFFDKSNYKTRFINFIEDKKEMSIYLDKKTLSNIIDNFSDDIKQYIIIDSTIFKAFQIFCDTNDIYSPGITSFISKKFADHKIPIIYTNSYNNSYILVPEKYFNNSCQILSEIGVNINE